MCDSLTGATVNNRQQGEFSGYQLYMGFLCGTDMFFPIEAFIGEAWEALDLGSLPDFCLHVLFLFDFFLSYLLLT